MLYILISTMMFAFGPILVRMGVAEGLAPEQLVVMRLSVAFPLFLLAVLLTGSLSNAKLKLRELPFIVSVSVFGMAVAMVCFFRSVYYLGASVASILGALTPAATAIMARIFLKRPVTLRQAGSIAVSFLGVLFLVVPMTGVLELGRVIGSSLTGVGFSLLATLFASGAGIGFEKYVEKKSPLVAAFHVTGFMFLSLSSVIGFPSASQFTPKLWGTVLLLGSVSWFVPFMLFFYGLREIGATGVVLVQNTGPFVTILAASWMFGEKLLPAQIVGMVMIISSVFILALDRKAHKEEDYGLPEG